MIRMLLRGGVARFEKRHGYDASYMRDIIDADALGGLKLAMATPLLSHRFGLPREAYFAAKLRSVANADCGPCLRLVIGMAETAGVTADVILAALGDGETSKGPDLAIRYADAVIANSGDAGEIVDKARRYFGRRGLAGLASAVVAGQFYPLMKRGMGHGMSCEAVRQDYLHRHGKGPAARLVKPGGKAA